VRAEHPLKQGLKPNVLGDVKEKIGDVRAEHPLKQGLKRQPSAVGRPLSAAYKPLDSSVYQLSGSQRMLPTSGEQWLSKLQALRKTLRRLWI